MPALSCCVALVGSSALSSISGQQRPQAAPQLSMQLTEEALEVQFNHSITKSIMQSLTHIENMVGLLFKAHATDTACILLRGLQD